MKFYYFREFNLSQIGTEDLLTPSEASETMHNFSPSLYLDGDQDQFELSCGAAAQQGQHVDIHQPHSGYPLLTNVYKPNLQHLDQLPITKDLTNDWNFDVALNGESSGKTSWMYSAKLNKVFVKIDNHLNVYISYQPLDNQVLFVRSMIVYTSKDDETEPVRKCANHRAKQANIMLHPDHILRCEAPETQYVGREDGKLFRDKLAIVIPMSAIASNEPLKLQFTCQNSCSGGINRKLTSLVFTLENHFGEVLGRKIMNFKVCSCPKRDKERDESNEDTTKLMLKKRKGDPTAPSTSKKVVMIVKQESDTTMSVDSDVPLLPAVPSDLQHFNPMVKQELNGCVVNIVLPDPELKRKILESAYDVVAGHMMKTGDEAYQPYLTDIKKQIGK